MQGLVGSFGGMRHYRSHHTRRDGRFVPPKLQNPLSQFGCFYFPARQPVVGRAFARPVGYRVPWPLLIPANFLNQFNLICPAGLSAQSVSSPPCKNILIFRIPKSGYVIASRPTEGR